MRLKKIYFPWKLFRSFVISYVLLSLLALIPLLVFLSSTLDSQAHPLQSESILKAFVIYLLSVLTLGALLGVSVYRPFAALFQRLRGIRRKPLEEVFWEDWIHEEKGEWSDFEVSIFRLKKDQEKTQRRRQEDRRDWEALLKAVRSPLLILSEKGEVEFMNDSCGDLFGLKAADVLGQSAFPFLRSSSIQAVFKRALEQGEMQKELVEVNHQRDSLVRSFQLTVNPVLKIRPKEMKRLIAVFHEVTDLINTEKMRKNFVANVSHELKSPMTSIKGYLLTLKEDLASGELSELNACLEVVSRNMDRMSALVEDLLQLALLESHPLIEKENIFLSRFLDELLLEIRKKAEEKSQFIQVYNQVDVVESDQRLLERLFFNLLENALKYTPEETRIEIFCERDENGGVRIRIKDSGPGIPKEHLTRVFERFYRIDSGRSRDVGGTGLGLAIVKHIMQVHGGSVSVQSEEGVGTEFACVFPSSGKGSKIAPK
jgi:two-component system, OmpR family, phosphate regulon sensor histidine kinase PhoR